MIELGEPAALLSGSGPPIPAPADLLPPDRNVTVQLVVGAVPAGGTGPAGASYRHLTDGLVPARQRALLAVRVSRTDPRASADDLRGTLAGTVRRICRRLRQGQIDCRPLPVTAAGAALAELATHDPAVPARESWSALALGGLCQTSLRVPRPDRLPIEVTALTGRLLALPATSNTVSLTASRAGTELVVRVAAGTPAGLTAAVRAASRLLATAGARAVKLDGEQRGGLAATLPLARAGNPGGTRSGTRRDASGSVGGTAVALAPSGLTLGRNRHHEPVTARLFRPEPTTVLLLGGVRAAQILTLRGLALGAQVTIQTARPHVWEPFLRAVSLPTGVVTLQHPGASTGPAPARPLLPQLIVLDVGPAAGPPVPPAAWRTSLVLREDVSALDTEALARADLVILQPLPPDQAATVGAALGLRESLEWLSRIRADMIGAVSRLDGGRKSVRWAVLSTTDLELQVIGAPERVAAP